VRPARDPKPRSSHQYARLAIQSAGKIEHRRPSTKRFAPMPAGHLFRTAEKCEIYLLKRVSNNRLNERNLISDLVQLPESIVFVEQGERGGHQRRIGDGFLQFLAQQGGSTDNCNLVHKFPCDRKVRSGGGTSPAQSEVV